MIAAPQKLIIDTDPGIDDAMAIHYALAEPQLELVGLTSIFGNVYVDQATRNALCLAEMAGADIPVAEGAAAPLVQPLNPPSHHVHGPEGFGRLPAASPAGQADPRPAWQFISETCRATAGGVTLCPVGPLTNIARLLDYDPGITGFVKRLVIMGGAAWCGGNVSAVAEANIWNDPHAAEAVFAADWQVEMVGLDVTSQIKCTRADFAGLAGAAPEIGSFLAEIADFYIDFYKGRLAEEVCLMHDPAAVLSIVRPDLFDWKEVPIEVVTSGEEVGRTRPQPAASRRPARIAVGVDAAAVRAHFLSITASADRLAATRQG